MCRGSRKKFLRPINIDLPLFHDLPGTAGNSCTCGRKIRRYSRCPPALLPAPCMSRSLQKKGQDPAMRQGTMTVPMLLPLDLFLSRSEKNTKGKKDSGSVFRLMNTIGKAYVYWDYDRYIILY